VSERRRQTAPQEAAAELDLPSRHLPQHCIPNAVAQKVLSAEPLAYDLLIHPVVQPGSDEGAERAPCLVAARGEACERRLLAGQVSSGSIPAVAR
jgi:hypothetical protein